MSYFKHGVTFRCTTSSRRSFGATFLVTPWHWRNLHKTTNQTARLSKQVSAFTGLNCGLNRFKPSWQKEISASFFGRNLSKHSPHYSAESYSTFIKYSQNYDFVEYLTRINVGICLIDKVGFKVCVLFVHTDYVNCYYLTLDSQMYFSFEIMHILNDSNN